MQSARLNDLPVNSCHLCDMSTGVADVCSLGKTRSFRRTVREKRLTRNLGQPTAFASAGHPGKHGVALYPLMPDHSGQMHGHHSSNSPSAPIV